MLKGTKIPEKAVDPLRKCHSGRWGQERNEYFTPTIEQAAKGVIDNPEILREVIRRVVWTDPEMVTEMIQAAQDRKQAVLAATREARFGRDYAARDARPFEGREF